MGQGGKAGSHCFYKIERPAESEEGSSESGKPEKKVLAVLEVTGGELGFDDGL